MIRPSGPQCLCAVGFQGNGTSCQGHKKNKNNSNSNKIIRADGCVCVCVCAAVDACQQANGGCSELAVCKRTQPGRRECVCGSGYHGDGLVCVGTCPSILLFLVPYHFHRTCCLLLHVNSPTQLFTPPSFPSSILPFVTEVFWFHQDVAFRFFMSLFLWQKSTRV